MERVVSEQIKTILDLYGKDIFKGSIIAYEPIWAIGSDSAASPEQIEKMCDFIKQLIYPNLTGNDDVNIVYGGSVNAKNAVQLCEINGVDGILMGRSSLDANEFFKICNSIRKI
jgi:triosephosphate isomerase